MHFAAAAFALLPAFGAATSYLRSGAGSQQAMVADANGPNEGNNPGDNNAGNAPGNNECGVSSFHQITQDAENQPLIQDCLDMLLLITKDESWEFGCQGMVIVTLRTCAFTAKVAEGHCDKTGYLGNADIDDLTRDSIKRFRGDNGTIGCKGGFSMYINANGGMKCDSPDLPQGQQVDVEWNIVRASGT